jgi:uncharacterized protein
MSETSATRHLVVFARYPTLGGGKRRLAAGVGAVTAVRFQRTVLSHILTRVSHDHRWTTWIAATPDASGLWPSGLRIIPQGRGDLGKRLQRLVTKLPPGPVVIVGSDIPSLTAAPIADAFAKLAGHDAVFGPAPDGGYWLIGLSRTGRRFRPFENVRWSTQDALRDTERAFCPARLAHVASLQDVDDVNDLKQSRWQRLIGA